MLTRLADLWGRLPAPVRTILNVGIAASILLVVGRVIDAQGVTGVDWVTVGPDALDAFALGVATAIFRAVNPLDDAYGITPGNGSFGIGNTRGLDVADPLTDEGDLS